MGNNFQPRILQLIFQSIVRVKLRLFQTKWSQKSYLLCTFSQKPPEERTPVKGGNIQGNEGTRSGKQRFRYKRKAKETPKMTLCGVFKKKCTRSSRQKGPRALISKGNKLRECLAWWLFDQTESLFSSVRVQDESEVATQKTKQLKNKFRVIAHPRKGMYTQSSIHL